MTFLAEVKRQSFETAMGFIRAQPTYVAKYEAHEGNLFYVNGQLIARSVIRMSGKNSYYLVVKI